jgi:hypothetical protein
MHQVVNSIDAYDRFFLETTHNSTKVPITAYVRILTLTCGHRLFYQSDWCILQITLFVVA